MKILATFIRRTCEPTSVELVHAWDEYSVDNYSEGYHDTLQKELDALGADLLDARTLLVEVDYDAVMDAFLQPTITGTISEVAR